MAADTLILGNIITMEPGKPPQEALTIKDGRVQFVGSAATARALCAEDTEILDFGEGTVYPGIVEGHCHPDLAGTRLKLQADLTSGNSMPEFVRIMAEFIQANPGLDEYRGAGWVELECKPTAAMLDDICPDIPVVLQSVDGHSMWMNTPALAKYGIDRGCVGFWGTDIIRVDAEGNPTGYISEGPCIEIYQKASYSLEQKCEAFLAWQEFAFSHGLTACLHAGVTEDVCKTYDSLIKTGKWKLRTYGVYYVDERSEDYVAKVREAQELAARYNSEYFQIVGIKIFLDGVVEAHTAWLLDDYADAPGTTGVKRMRDFGRVTELFAAATEAGYLVHCHTIGDGAAKFTIDCIEAAQLQTGTFTARHALCHLQVIRPEDIQRMADLRITPVVAPLWSPKVPTYYRQEVDYLGRERAAAAYPIKSFADAGATIAFHTDYPVSTDMNVPLSVYTAALRTKPKYGKEGVRNAAERISREEALAALTSGAAYSMKQEDTLGMLAPGYVANMVVFDKDFLEDDLESIAQAKLIATIVDGKTVYSA